MMLKIVFMFYRHGCSSIFQPFLVVRRQRLITAKLAARWKSLRGIGTVDSIREESNHLQMVDVG